MTVDFSNSLRKDYSWTDWKSIYNAKTLSPQYNQDSEKYIIYGFDGPEAHACIIWLSNVPYAIANSYSQAQNDADKSDFENNYKSIFNVSVGFSTRGVFTDRSGTTSATPNTSTQIMPINLHRKYLFIQNVDEATIWINFTAAANVGQPSIEIVSGASFVLEGSAITTEAVNIFSEIASVPFTAKEK